ncbi:uncharacterized protein RAG0_01103 [Rhynchosporium agropyri]|uniref:Zn(2)-C6 fungal-type domain-containing protein n=1 Tax=Rhynchosporium agropyri TaxID=914238 RepID=A0A1E1JVJ4_9HELO|nr:uncharacterized protein RAG0_01103 [Rhynchosporium agropyri]
MVNTGKPSRGCYMCRARRIKCDEGKPGCMRCQKSKRICPGYRDAVELKLRDDNKSSKKKLNKRSPEHSDTNGIIIYNSDGFSGNLPSTTLSHSRHSSLSSLASSSNGYTTDYVHIHHTFTAGHLTTPLAQQASCYFLANFVLVPEQGSVRGHLDFVLPLLKQRDPPQSLVLAFSAVTLAALGSRPNSKVLLPTADLWYLKALKEIKLVLQDPKAASTDSTLAAVMLMAAFEQLTPSRMKVGGWSSHIDGAVAVIKSRTMEQWRTPLGKKLFTAARAHMIVHSIAQSKAINPGVDWLGVISDDPIIQKFDAANLKMAQLRADNDLVTSVKVRSAETTENVLRLLRRAESLDKEYTDWMKSLPPLWQHNTVAWVDAEIPDLGKSMVHPGRIDSYSELWIAFKCNLARGCRLFIWTTILRCVAWLSNDGDYRLTPEYTTAIQTCRPLIEDIVASVPYFFGWNRGIDPAMYDGSSFACGEQNLKTVKPLAGIFAMWPIFTAASSDFASPSQHIFLKGKLKYTVESMGINQARIMFQAQLLHPSLYIARERMSVPIHACQVRDAEDDKLAAEGSPPPPILPMDMPLPVSSSPIAKEPIFMPEPHLWAQTPPLISQFLPSSQEKLWMPVPTSESLWLSTPPPEDFSTPTLPTIEDRKWSTSPPGDEIWNSPSGTLTPPTWIPRTFTDPVYIHESHNSMQGPTVTYQDSPEYDRDYHTFEHAGFGAISSA